jgi:hypothetical protein
MLRSFENDLHMESRTMHMRKSHMRMAILLRVAPKVALTPRGQKADLEKQVIGGKTVTTGWYTLMDGRHKHERQAKQ